MEYNKYINWFHFFRKATITVGAFTALFIVWKQYEHVTFHHPTTTQIETHQSKNHIHLERMEIPEKDLNIFIVNTLDTISSTQELWVDSTIYKIKSSKKHIDSLNEEIRLLEAKIQRISKNKK